MASKKFRSGSFALTEKQIFKIECDIPSPYELKQRELEQKKHEEEEAKRKSQEEKRKKMKEKGIKSASGSLRKKKNEKLPNEILSVLKEFEELDKKIQQQKLQQKRQQKKAHHKSLDSKASSMSSLNKATDSITNTKDKLKTEALTTSSSVKEDILSKPSNDMDSKIEKVSSQKQDEGITGTTKPNEKIVKETMNYTTNNSTEIEPIRPTNFSSKNNNISVSRNNEITKGHISDNFILYYLTLASFEKLRFKPDDRKNRSSIVSLESTVDCSSNGSSSGNNSNSSDDSKSEGNGIRGDEMLRKFALRKQIVGRYTSKYAQHSKENS